MMFAQKVEEISHQLRCQIERRYQRHYTNIPFGIKLSDAIELWCLELNIYDNITSYILDGCKLSSVKQLTECIWQEAVQDKKTWKIPTPFGEAPTFLTTENQFYNQINSFFNLMRIGTEDTQLIVLIGFGITTVGYFLYGINRKGQQLQQSTPIEKSREYVPNPLSSSVQNINKYFLALVISASKEEFLKSIDNKGRIDFNVGEELYEMTQYLWLGSETAFNQSIHSINQYLVSEGKESEYDIHLVSFELKQAHEGFKPNINQLDRYDAFRKLSDLVVNFEISPRLRMEAYENLEVYNR
jgi:hypothetical protein